MEQSNQQEQPQTTTQTPAKPMFPAPVVKYSFEWIGDQYAGAHVNYIPFSGADCLDLETRPQTEAISAFYELAEKYFVDGQLPKLNDDGSYSLQELKKEDIRQIPYSYLLKWVQAAIAGELPENFTKKSTT